MSKELEQILGDKYAIYSVLPIAERRGFLIGYNMREEEIKELSDAIKGFVRDFETDYVMSDGRIVDNPINILVTNYEIMKKVLTKN